jgi:hypothetical protein
MTADDERKRVAYAVGGHRPPLQEAKAEAGFEEFNPSD